MRDAASKILPRRALACCIAAALAPAAYAGPEGAQIVAGSGAITQTDAATTLITQSSDRLAIDWQSFNVGVNERVRFEQPSAQAAALNRIFDQNPSAILGALEANGHVYLLNPNGMVFGSTARIDVGALIASSLDLKVDDFVAGRYDFAASNAAAGLVVNRGVIQAATGGSVTLLGGAVANEGLILADLGQVTLGAGQRARLDFDGDGLLYFEVDEAAVTNPGAGAAVSNTGTIRADGGQVLLTARAAQNVFSEVVNNGGLVRATRVDDSGGVVRLLGTGGSVVTTGRIAATGATADDAGGRVEVLGDRVGVLGDASIDVSGSAGGSILVGGDHRGGGGATSAVTLVGADATLTADARTTGDGGDVVVWGDVGTWFRGSASARGGELSGDGGFVEISGESLVFSGTVDTRAPNGRLGTLLFDPSTITIVNGAGGADDGDLPTLTNNGGNDTTPFVISEQALEALGLGTDIVLEATGNIVMQDLADNLLGLATDGSLTIAADVDDDGTGSFTMDGSDTIRTEGGDVVISGAGLTIGSIDITGATGTATGDLILLVSTEGATIAGSLTAANAISVNVDTDNDEIATLRLGGTLTASSATVAGSADADDVLEGRSGADAFVGNANAAGTLNGVAFAQFDTLSGLGGADSFDLSADFASALGGTGNDTFAVASSADIATLDGGADADAVTLAAGASVGTLAGGAGGTDNDTLASAAGAYTWSVTALDAGSLNGNAFGEFENLAGGSGADTFTFTAAVTGTVTGGAGGDAFAVNGVSLASLDGGADSDTVTFAPGAAVGTLTGGAGGSDDDTLAITTGTNTWTVTGADAGVLNSNFFTEFENLSGGDGTDTFAFLSSLSGTASGGAGDDTFNVLAGSVGAVNGGASADTLSYAGSATARTLTVAGLVGSGIELVVGSSSGADVLQGTGSDDAFVTTGFDAGTANGTLAYSSFESVQGLAGLDTFTLQHGVSGTVDGGADADTFMVGAGAVAGNLVGGTGADTLCHCGPAAAVFTLTAANAGTLNAVSFAGVENLTGSAANDVFNLAFDLSGTAAGGGGNDVFNLGPDADATVTGGAGTDTIAAAATQPTVFTVTAANAGTIGNGAGTVSFGAIENLTGSDGDDTFALNASLAGTASGGAGDDTFVAAAGVATAVVGDAGSDRLVGSNSASAFTVSSANAGTLAQGGNSVTFVSVENLNGGTANDTFSLLADITGTVSGEGGDDAFALASNVSASIAGNAGADRVEVAAASTFAVSGANSGQITGGTSTVAFSTVESLRGSAHNDTFTFNGALTGTAFGLGGDDTFAVNDGGSAGAIDGGAGTDTQTYAGLTGPVIVTLGGLTSIENLVGSSDGGDTLVATAADDVFATTSANAGTVNGLAYASFENLQGSGGADHFTLNHSPSGTVDGGAGNDTFTLLAAVAGQVSGGAGSDRFEVRANVSGELAGGDGDDVYAIADGASATGVLDGAAGRDTLDLSAYRSARAVTLTDEGAVDGFDGNASSISTFRNIDAVAAGSSSASTLRGRDADATWTVEGANGNVYSSAGSSLSFAGFANLSGGSGADRFRLGTANVTDGLAVNGGAGNDRVETVGNLTVGGTLAITGVETVANPGAAVLAADSLTIDGATAGVGTAAAPLLVQLASVEVLHSGGGLFLVDRTGDLRVVNAQLGTGDARIVVDQGNLLVGFIDAGGTGAPTAPPAVGIGGNVELVASQGSILDNGAAVNVRGRTATLRARLHIGEPSNPVTIVVPSNETIRLSAVNATIDNISLATVDDALVLGVFSDFTANATAAAVGAGAASSVLDVSAIDWVGLDPNVTLVDCVEPCVLLPVDQQEDDGFALLRDATKLLVLRDGERLALIPMLDRSALR